MKITRRDFIGKAAAVAGIGVLAPAAHSAPAAKRWYKGNLHMHSFWSDGKAFPEEAVLWYKSRGYNFIGLSDHNVFQDRTDRWVTVSMDGKESGKVKRRHFDDYVKAFPDAEVRKNAKGATVVRLRTFAELEKRFNAPGEFLMMPNVEATRHVKYNDGVIRQLHMNYVNLPQLLDSYREKTFRSTISDKSLEKALRDNAAETAALAGKLGKPHLFILNHPNWAWYDVGPEALIDNPEVRFFEVCNNGAIYAPAKGMPTDGFDADRFWDVVNAFRARRGQNLLYGIGTDDTHRYNGERRQAGNSWSLVRSESLNAASLIAAMNRGDFVTCEGLEPEDVNFDASSKTLEVSVAAKAGVSRTVRFIVSKKDFSEKPVRTIEVVPAEQKADKKRFRRSINVYDGRIGMTVKSVVGKKGEPLKVSYTMASDDLYVRARIEEDGVPLCKSPLHPQGKLVAWTQPYA